MTDFSPEEQDVIIAFGLCPQCGSDDILWGKFLRKNWGGRPQFHCGCLSVGLPHKDDRCVWIWNGDKQEADEVHV